MLAQRSGLAVGNAALVEELLVFHRHLQLGGSCEDEARVEVAHGLQQRVHRAAVLEVTHHIDGEAVEAALGLADRIHVEQRLAGVLVGAVARIHHRQVADLAGIAGRTFEGVAHDYYVDIVRNHLDGVLEAFTLADRGVVYVAEADDSRAETVGSGLEAQARAGRRLEEQAGDHLAVQDLLAFVLFHLGSHIEDVKHLLLGKIVDRNQALWHISVFFNNCLNLSMSRRRTGAAIMQRSSKLCSSGVI